MVAPADSGQFSSFTRLTDMTQLFDALLSDTSHGELTKGTTKTIDGIEAIGLDSSKGGTLFIATTGSAYPLELSKPGADGGTVSFTDWNASVDVSEPSDALDYTQLTGG